MKTDYDTTASWEEECASKIIDKVCDSLREEDKKSMAELARDAYDWVLPALRAGRHMNPIHHTPQVVQFLVQIVLKEQGLEESALKQGIVAAMFHDSGNAFEPKGEEKTTKGDVDADPSLREKEELTRLKKSIGLRNIVVTLGKKGAVALTENDEFLKQPAFCVECVDETGAGDAFVGGFLYARCMGKDFQKSLQYGTAAAAVQVTVLGGRPGITLGKVEEMLRDGKEVG